MGSPGDTTQGFESFARIRTTDGRLVEAGLDYSLGAERACPALRVDSEPLLRLEDPERAHGLVVALLEANNHPDAVDADRRSRRRHTDH